MSSVNLKANMDIEKNISDTNISPTTKTRYTGMSKEELAAFTDLSLWVAIRWLIFIIFWIACIGLLAGSITIVALSSPTCSVVVDTWWQSAVVYQIYPRSFQDTNGDGNGDLKGISSRLDYLTALGVGAVWLNPIYKSPQVDNGYDVEDYREIDAMYGSMQDFDKLVQDLHSRDMKIIMDFIPNHTSDKHRWFEASRANNSEENIYRDYYVWKDGEPGTPPNNWISAFGGSAWTYVSSRQQWYLHQYAKEQPDLNVRNEIVRKELEDILIYWMNKGVDGFRIDAIKRLYEHEEFPDEPLSGLTNDSWNPDYLIPIYTIDQPETYDVIQQWSDLIKNHNPEVAILTEATTSNLTNVLKYYEYGSDVPFNFQLVNSITKDCVDKTKCIYDAIMLWMTNMPSDGIPNWQVGNHDNKRISSRLGAQYVNNINIMLLLLPGTPTVYYGEEIGMRDNEEYYQPETNFNRRYCRTPMQWNNNPNAGFTNSSLPWLAVNNDYEDINVLHQDSDDSSVLSLYKHVMDLRKEMSFSDVWGETKFSNQSRNILAFTRKSHKDDNGYLVLLNFGETASVYNPSDLSVMSGDIILKTPNMNDLNVEEHIDLFGSSLSLLPGQGLVIRYRQG